MGHSQRLGSSVGSPPTLKRRDWQGWIVASSMLGLLSGGICLLLSWRQILVWNAPSGGLSIHMVYWLKLLIASCFPGWFENDRLTYEKYWSEIGSDGQLGIWARVAIAGVAAVLPSVWLARSYLVPRDRLIHLRGGRRYEGREAIRELKRKLAGHVRRWPDHPIAPGLTYSGDLWTRHVLIVGGVGSGKSTVIRPLLATLIENDETLFVFDPKGEFTKAFDRPALLAPWDARSWAWDIAKDMRSTSDMSRFAVAMIKDSQDPLWSNAARQVLVGVIRFLQQTKGQSWSWLDLAAALQLPQAELLAIMQDSHPVAIRALEEANLTSAGILINLGSYCSPIFDLATAWGEIPLEKRVCLRDWLRGKSRVKQLIVQGHGGHSELTKSYVAAMVETISALVNSVEMPDSTTRKIWFVADEFSKMGRIPVLPLFDVGRSRGVRCVVACQDFGQLEELHGEKSIQALLSMCGTVIVGQMLPGKTAKELAELMGAREVERPASSTALAGKSGREHGGGKTFSRENVPLYVPSEFASRLGLTKDKRGVRMILQLHGDAHELVWPHFAMTKRRKAHVPAGWTLPVSPQSPSKPSDADLRVIQLQELFSQRIGPNEQAENNPNGESDHVR